MQAASIGPRLFSRGNPRPLEPASTLCGRFNWAATFQPRKHPDTLRDAFHAWVLQLGRDFSAAETWQPSRTWSAWRASFNWAATFQPRKLLVIAWDAWSGGRLQLGRDFSAAETGKDSTVLLHLVRASIGPRLFSRGNVHAGQVPGPARTRFNWAATFQPRKPLDHARTLLHRLEASIGPRLFSRGN